jgi:hypothetical protein
MTTLDFLAAHAVARARVLERAVHDSGHWQVEINDQREDAVKVRTPHRVVFLANFYWLPEPEQAEVAWLLCDGEMISSMDVRLSGPAPYAIEWSVGPDSVETQAVR